MDWPILTLDCNRMSIGQLNVPHKSILSNQYRQSAHRVLYRKARAREREKGKIIIIIIIIIKGPKREKTGELVVTMILQFQAKTQVDMIYVHHPIYLRAACRPSRTYHED